MLGLPPALWIILLVCLLVVGFMLYGVAAVGTDEEREHQDEQQEQYLSWWKLTKH